MSNAHTAISSSRRIVAGTLLLVMVTMAAIMHVVADDSQAPASSQPADTNASPPPTDESNDYQAYIALRPFRAGYRRQEFEYAALDGSMLRRQLDLWYPADEREAAYLYLYQRGQVAVDADVAEGKHPLVLFSHGFMGASDQSIYIMEALARAGYIVAAVNHNDALLNQRDQSVVPPRAFDLDEWNDMMYADRRHDVVMLLDELLAWNETSDHRFEGRIDPEEIGAIGHSLGGYTVMGLAGAWPSWRDERIKVAILYSPFVHPFRENGDLGSVTIPVMMQGATFDIGISQYLLSIYRRLECPRHYLILEGATHLVWTNLVSVRSTTVDCLEEENPCLIVEYSIAFLDHFLLGQDRSEMLEADEPRLHDWAAHLDVERQ